MCNHGWRDRSPPYSTPTLSVPTPPPCFSARGFRIVVMEAHSPYGDPGRGRRCEDIILELAEPLPRRVESVAKPGLGASSLPRALPRILASLDLHCLLTWQPDGLGGSGQPRQNQELFALVRDTSLGPCFPNMAASLITPGVWVTQRRSPCSPAQDKSLSRSRGRSRNLQSRESYPALCPARGPGR